MNKKNTTVISAIVVVLVVIVGGFGWHHHKQKTEINGEWVDLVKKNSDHNMITNESLDMLLLNVKHNKFQFKEDMDYPQKDIEDVRTRKTDEHKGSIELNNKDKEVSFTNPKETHYVDKYQVTGHYKLSKDKNFLTIDFPEDSDIASVLASRRRGHAVFVRKGSSQYNKMHHKAMKQAKAYAKEDE